MTHAGYILAAYLATALVIGGLVLWVVLGARAQKRQLRQLEEEGVVRRGAAGGTSGTAT
jgi:heme exporter protein D